MNVALIGASGNVGTRILAELAARGHSVTAIARHPEKITIPSSSSVTPKQGDLFQPAEMANILRGHDAVISTVFFTQSNPADLIQAVRESGVRRYIVVGGAGSLEVAPGVRLFETPDFPPDYAPEAKKGVEFFDALRKVTDLDWTFISPSAEFGPGERTGKFCLGSDQLLVSPAGSKISFEDFAVALVDELEKPAHIRERFTVGY